MASPTTELREAVKGVLTTEFAAEAFPVRDDRLHGSLGSNGPIAGVYPTSEGGGGALAGAISVTVQVFGRYQLEIDPTQAVDPAAIEAWSWRFRRALRGLRVTDGTHVWMLNVTRITYPPDPTGNITRFEAQVDALGPNPSVVETTA